MATYDGNDWEIFVFDGNQTTQLTDNDYPDDWPKVSGAHVVWEGMPDGDWEIFDAVPEPATLGLLALGGLAVLKRRKRVGDSPKGEAR